MKKVLVTLLTLIVFCFSLLSSITAGAVSSIDRDMLEEKCDKFYSEYVSYYGIVPYLGPYYADESRQNMITAINEAKGLIESSKSGEKISADMFENAYQKLLTAQSEMYMDKSELECLIVMCESQTNDSSYFDEQTWNSFQTLIQECYNTVDNGSNAEINEKYYSLLQTMNKLCTYNKVLGDIDGDGVCSVKDATYIQKSLSKNNCKLNFSQCLVSSFDNYSSVDVSIKNVTDIQKYIANTLTPKQYCPIEQECFSFGLNPNYQNYFYKVEIDSRYIP